jgi:hypothetical protein
MSTRDQTFIEQGISVVDNKIYSYIDSDWRVTGLLNEQHTSATTDNNGDVILGFDSTFDPLQDALTPAINLTVQDINGDDIQWTVSRNVAYGGALFKITGDVPLITLTPYKAIGDDAKIDTLSLVAKVNGGLPDLGYDSFDTADGLVKIDLTYNFAGLNVTYTNTEKAYSLLDIGLPEIEYISTNPFTLPSNIEGFDWNASGSKITILSNNDDKIYQYALTVNFDITTMVDAPTSFIPYGYYGSDFTDIKFGKNGERMYILRSGRNVTQYNLLTPYDITTAKLYESQWETDDFGNMGGLSRLGDYNYSLKNNKLYQWGLSDSDRISSSTYDPISNVSIGTYNDIYIVYRFNYSGSGGRVRYNAGTWTTTWDHVAPQRGLCFSQDGKYLYTASGIAIFNGKIERYFLTDPWVAATAILDQTIYHEFGAATTQNYERNYKNNELSEIRISNDGTEFFILDRQTASLYQFNMSTPYSLNSLYSTLKPVPKGAYDGGYDYVYDLSEIPNPASTYTSNNHINSFDFNDSGNKIYVINDSDVYQYSLSSPYNIQNMSFVLNKTISELTSGEASISVRRNKFYLHNPGITYEYDMDSSVSSLVKPYKTKDLYVSEEGSITSFDMNDSGTRLYIGGTDNNNIHSYDLSEPNEIYSAIHNNSFETNPEVTNLQAISVVGSADKMFGIDNSSRIYEFDMIEPFDSSEYNNVVYQPTGNNTSLSGMRFNNIGDFFYLSGNNGIDAYKTKNNFRVKPI